jgi:hypothetical protein
MRRAALYHQPVYFCIHFECILPSISPVILLKSYRQNLVVLRSLVKHCRVPHLIIAARFQFLDPHLLDSAFLCPFNPVSNSSNQKSTYATFSHPTPPIGRTHCTCSKVTIFYMPFHVISPLPPPTRSPFILDRTYRRADSRMEALARTRIDMWPLSTFTPFFF